MLHKVRKWDRFAKQIVLRTSWEPTESHFDEIRKKIARKSCSSIRCVGLLRGQKTTLKILALEFAYDLE